VRNASQMYASPPRKPQFVSGCSGTQDPYAEKAKVADYIEDQIEFMRTGQIEMRRDATSLNLSRVARAAQRIVEAALEKSSDRSLNFPLAPGRKCTSRAATGFATRDLVCSGG
jgi:hypothetical protein